MKRLLLTMFLIGTTFTTFSQSQLYQSGFNMWTSWELASTPSLWNSAYNEGFPVGTTPAPISKLTDASHLLTSVKLETTDGGGNPNMAFILLGGLGSNGPVGGIPFTLSADSLIFDAKYDIGLDDSANVYCILKNSGIPLDMGVFKIGGTQPNWTRMAFKINALNLTPDSLILAFTSSNADNNSTKVVGSWIQIDNIRFVDGTTYSSPIPNPSFENWDVISAEDANEWTSMNSIYAGLGVATVTKSTDAQEGTYAMNLTSDSLMQQGSMNLISAMALYGTFDSNFNPIGKSFAASPTSMTGYYKWSPVDSDVANISVSFQSAGSIVGGGNFDFTTAQGTYTQFTIPLTITSSPDTILVIINGGQVGGSSLLIDNIQFAGGNVGVKTIHLTDATISVFPNPTSEDATLRIALPKSAIVSYNVLNTLGQSMDSDNLGSMKDGIHTVKLDTSSYSTGIYFVKVKIGETTMTQKVIVK